MSHATKRIFTCEEVTIEVLEKLNSDLHREWLGKAIDQGAVFKVGKTTLGWIIGFLNTHPRMVCALLNFSPTEKLDDLRLISFVKKDDLVLAGVVVISVNKCTHYPWPQQSNPILSQFDEDYESLLESWDEDGKNLTTVYKQHRQFWSTLNPPEFKEFPGTKLRKDALEGFFIRPETYRTVWPDKCTPKMPEVARSVDIQIHQDLQMYIIMPNQLHSVKDSRCVRIAIDFHGGGGFTGHPLFEPWQHQAWREYMHQAGDIISIEPTYSLMPESSGTDVLQDIAYIRTWLFTKLEGIIKQINPFLKVAWGRLSISGSSFGGGMALLLYREIALHPRPPGFAITKIILRYPVSEYYHREPGSYMDVYISREQAERDCSEIILAMEKLDWVKKRAGSEPPRFMYGAYAFSVSAKWSNTWNEPSVHELLEQVLHYPETQIVISHGTEDKHVRPQSSERLTKTFCSRGLCTELRLEPGKLHAYDYKEPLTKGLIELWDAR